MKGEREMLGLRECFCCSGWGRKLNKRNVLLFCICLQFFKKNQEFVCLLSEVGEIPGKLDKNAEFNIMCALVC